MVGIRWAEIDVVEEPAQRVVHLRRVVPRAEVGTFLGRAFVQVSTAAAIAGGEIVGPPFSWFQGMPSGAVDVAAGFPVAGPLRSALAGEVEVLQRPGATAVAALHVGPYEALERTYAELDAWLHERGATARVDRIEEYLRGPADDVDASTWRTRVVVPLVGTLVLDLNRPLAGSARRSA